jgi:RNA polymerase sigma-70 factor (ECF subfamily)
MPLSTETPASDDRELVRRATSDAEAWGELYRRYLPRVYRYARARSPNGDEAADLTQEIFLKASEALVRYRERGAPFAAWLFRIARNAAIDRSRRRRPVVSLESLVAVPGSEDLEAGAIANETRATFRLHSGGRSVGSRSTPTMPRDLRHSPT